MDTAKLVKKLDEYRKKQISLAASWRKIGKKDLLKYITEILPGSLDAERCGIFIVDLDDKNIWIVSGTHIEERALWASVENSIAGRVISTGESVELYNLEDQGGDHIVSGVKTGFVIRNLLCVPVKSKSKDKVIAAIQLLNKCGGNFSGGNFTNKDRRMLAQLADLVQENLEQIYGHQKLAKILEDLEKHIEYLEGLMIEAKIRGDIGG